PSGRYRLLHPTDALVHNIVHAQLHHAAYLCRSVRMKNLYDFALIASRSGSLIDWESIQHAARAPLYPRAARWHMALARELFPWSGIPAMDSSDPFARLRSGMSPRRELSYKRNMNRLNTLLFEPRFVSGRLLRKLFSPFSLPQTLHEASGAARNVFSRWSRQS
ncbi:MAG TPA: nucleotidyltransferase family protein, partial [Bryobacteraceae bacterium]|nr:nucleotidyltransferase family protein [Bryobacteraceae bacterium]